MQISQAAIQWLANGERGVSSNTIFTHMTGIEATNGWGHDVPHDPADLRRCRLLLERCPEFMPQFREHMGKASPKWAALVARWDELCAVMDEETPQWRNPPHGARSTKTYDLLKQIIGR